MKCSPDALHRAIANRIARHPRTPRVWNESEGAWKEWTRHLSIVVGDTFRTRAGLEPVHKWSPDEEGRKEYLNIDVIGSDGSWGPPVAVCELENQYHPEWLLYSLWKLLSVQAQFRLLIGYYNPNARKHPKDPRKLADRLAKKVGKKFESRRSTPVCYVTLADWRGLQWTPRHFRIRGDRLQTLK